MLVSPGHRLKYEAELGRLAGEVARDGLPLPPRPEATMALGVAVRDTLAAAGAPPGASDTGALVARVFDATMQRLPRDQAGGEIACKTGCTYCCHNVVMATAPEIFLAARELAASREPAFAAAVAGRCDAAGATAGIRRNPCALLDDTLCSVYAARPTVCRKHTSFSLEACVAEYEGRGGNIPIRRFDQAVFECCAVALLIGMRLWRGGEPCVYELSGALGKVLREPEAEARWLAGEDVFQGVASQAKLPGLEEHAAFLWGRFVEG